MIESPDFSTIERRRRRPSPLSDQFGLARTMRLESPTPRSRSGRRCPIGGPASAYGSDRPHRGRLFQA